MIGVYLNGFLVMMTFKRLGLFSNGDFVQLKRFICLGFTELAIFYYVRSSRQCIDKENNDVYSLKFNQSSYHF